MIDILNSTFALDLATHEVTHTTLIALVAAYRVPVSEIEVRQIPGDGLALAVQAPGGGPRFTAEVFDEHAAWWLSLLGR